MNSVITLHEERFKVLEEDVANNQIAGLHEELASIKKMEDSQNHVLRNCHETVQDVKAQMIELSRVDYEDKFNNITRKMISDVVREHLTPVQMSMNLDLKQIKTVIEEHAGSIEQFAELFMLFKKDLQDFRLKNVFESQNNKKETEGYLRELNRMQKLEHIRVQVTEKQRKLGAMSLLNKTSADLQKMPGSAPMF